MFVPQMIFSKVVGGPRMPSTAYNVHRHEDIIYELFPHSICLMQQWHNQ